MIADEAPDERDTEQLFRSNEELFDAVRDLVSRLKDEGRAEAAATLEEGFRCINGLTDGAALFLEAIETVRAEHSEDMTSDERRMLRAVRGAVRRVVYRR